MHPKMIPVLSSQIEGIQYLKSDHVLLITFLSGKTYAYDDVPEDIFAGFQTAPSKGKYLNAVVKQGGFEFRIVSEFELDVMLANAGFGRPKARSKKPPSVRMDELVLRYPFLRHAF